MTRHRRCRYRPARGTFQSSPGFSLLEILLVLAVFVVISALAVPSVTNIFATQHLKSGADIVRARLSEARVKSVQTGNVFGFFYQPGSGEYWVGPLSQGRTAINSGTPVPNRLELENEVQFVAGESTEDARSRAASEDAMQAAFRPVLFYPDGSAQDAVIVLRATNGLQIQVQLRGLTGISSKSRIFADEGGGIQ